jgi:hypothetical protein
MEPVKAQNWAVEPQGKNSGRSTRTNKQVDSHGKFVVEEELKVGL